MQVLQTMQEYLFAFLLNKFTEMVDFTTSLQNSKRCIVSPHHPMDFNWARAWQCEPIQFFLFLFLWGFAWNFAIFLLKSGFFELAIDYSKCFTQFFEHMSTKSIAVLLRFFILDLKQLTNHAQRIEIFFDVIQG